MTKHFKVVLVCIAGIVIMSLESLLIKLTNINSYTFVFYCNLCVFIFASIYLIFNKNKINFLFKKDLLPIMICGSIMACSNIMFVKSIKLTFAANVVLIFATTSLFSAFYAYVLFKEKTTKNIYISSIFIFLGLCVIFGDIPLGDQRGNFLALLATNLFALYFVLLHKFKTINRILVILAFGFIGSLLSFFLTNSLKIDFDSLKIIIITGLLVTPISRILISESAKFIPGSEIGLLNLIETAIAPVWVWIFLNEVPSLSTLYGGIIILTTLFLNSLYVMKFKNTVKNENK